MKKAVVVSGRHARAAPGAPLRLVCGLVAMAVAAGAGAEDRPVMQNGAGSPTLADLLEEEEQAAPPPVPTPDGDKPPVPRARLPVPAAAARARAESSVKEVFGEDLEAATTPDAKKALCAKLLGYADESTDHVTRFVLLGKAWRLSVDASDLDEAVKIGRRLAETYEVNGTDLEIQALKTVASGGPTARLGPAVDGLLAAARVVAETDVGRAEELAQAAAMAARKAKDRERGAAAVELLAELKDAKKREQRIKPLRERLQESPNDAEAATELGCILCFEDEDWDQGLSLLKKGNDSDLATLAQRDLAAQAGNASSILAADAWWDHGKSNKGAVAAACLQRARFHYLAALDDAKGLDRAKIEKRLQSLDQEMKTTSGPARKSAANGLPGLVFWLDAADAKSLRGAGASPKPGDPVAAWKDVGGGGFDAVAHQPQAGPRLARFGASRLNALEFDGAATGLVVRKPLPLRSISGLTLVAVVDFPGPEAVQNGRIQTVFDNQHDLSGGFCLQLRGELGGRPIEFGSWPLPSPGYAVLSDAAIPLRGPTVIVAVNTAGENTLYVTGQSPSRKPNTGPAKCREFFAIGGWFDPGTKTLQRHFAGRVGEVMLYGRPLTEAEMTTLVQSLKTKWAVR